MRDADNSANMNTSGGGANMLVSDNERPVSRHRAAIREDDGSAPDKST